MKVIRTCDLLSTKYSLRNTYSFNTFSTHVALLYPPPPPPPKTSGNLRLNTLVIIFHLEAAVWINVIKSPENISCCIKLLL